MTICAPNTREFLLATVIPEQYQQHQAIYQQYGFDQDLYEIWRELVSTGRLTILAFPTIEMVEKWSLKEIRWHKYRILNIWHHGQDQPNWLHYDADESLTADDVVVEIPGWLRDDDIESLPTWLQDDADDIDDLPDWLREDDLPDWLQDAPEVQASQPTLISNWPSPKEETVR